MEGQFSRLELLVGREAVEKLHSAKVAIFGVGGVGGHVCEALVRCGIGEFHLIDNDAVSLSNLNRQIIATRSTLGRDKVDVMKERMLDINPDVKVNVHKMFFLPETAGQFDFEGLDYVIDAIDTVAGKIEIIMRARAAGVPVISSMGTGNKMNPAMLRVTDIHKTQIDPLARVMRHEMKKRGVKKLKVVYSEEPAMKPMAPEGQETPPGKRSTPGSTSFVPASAGLMIASEVIKDLLAREQQE